MILAQCKGQKKWRSCSQPENWLLQFCKNFCCLLHWTGSEMPKSQFDYFIISSKYQMVITCLLTEKRALSQSITCPTITLLTVWWLKHSLGFFVMVTGVYSLLQHLLCKVDIGIPYFWLFLHSFVLLTTSQMIHVCTVACRDPLSPIESSFIHAWFGV